MLHMKTDRRGFPAVKLKSPLLVSLTAIVSNSISCKAAVRMCSKMCQEVMQAGPFDSYCHNTEYS